MSEREEFLAIVSLSIVFFAVVLAWALSGAPGCIPDGMMLPVCARPDLGVLSALAVVMLVLGVYLWVRGERIVGGGERVGEAEEEEERK